MGRQRVWTAVTWYLWMLPFNFFYGLRNPTPFVLATCGLCQKERFSVFNALERLLGKRRTPPYTHPCVVCLAGGKYSFLVLGGLVALGRRLRGAGLKPGSDEAGRARGGGRESVNPGSRAGDRVGRPQRSL
jgi:hypothetical protein